MNMYIHNLYIYLFFYFLVTCNLLSVCMNKLYEFVHLLFVEQVVIKALVI